MGSTYHSVHIHVVFSCKDRKLLITPEIKHELFVYISGVCDKRQCKLIEGGGTADHVHLLIGLSMTKSISDLLRDIKTNTSRWIHEKWPSHEFGWQDGYGAFSVSASLMQRTRDYIRNQEAHHAKKTFEAELDEIFKMHGMKQNPDGSVSVADTTGDSVAYK
ncbi:MAG: IS200/IS605 family transposase [Planctomycetota bacterium]